MFLGYQKNILLTINTFSSKTILAKKPEFEKSHTTVRPRFIAAVTVSFPPGVDCIGLPFYSITFQISQFNKASFFGVSLKGKSKILPNWHSFLKVRKLHKHNLKNAQQFNTKHSFNTFGWNMGGEISYIFSNWTVLNYLKV